MEPIILPFRLNHTWLGIDLERVQGVDSCGKISLIPQADPPLVGLMQKSGSIYPIWSLFSIVNGKIEDMKTCPCYIEISVKDKMVMIPAHEILMVQNLAYGWVPVFKHGIKLYRSLDQKKPEPQAIVQETKEESYEDSPYDHFSIEEIS